jgi:hypothetical protein
MFQVRSMEVLRRLAVTAVLAAAAPAGADERFRVGPMGGGTLFWRSGYQGDPNPGAAGGLALDLRLGSALWLALRPGYYQKGYGGWDIDYVGTPVLLRYPARHGVYGLAGVDVNVKVGDGGLAPVDKALTAGLGTDFGSGRARGFVEWRFSWSVGTSRGGWIAAVPPAASRKGPAREGVSVPPERLVVDAMDPSYRGILVVLGFVWGSEGKSSGPPPAQTSASSARPRRTRSICAGSVGPRP